MTPIQQLMLGAGGASEKTYLDDVFSTYIYNGTGSSGNAISNGINLSEEGGLVWVKNRKYLTETSHILFDSEIGDKYLRSNVSNEAADFYGQGALNSSGFTVGGDWGTLNEDGENFSSWTFRKAPGFFDVVTWTGNETARTIDHDLRSIPGTIIVKCTSESRPWTVWHRSTSDPATKYLVLNESDSEAATGSAGTQNDMWNSSAPDANSFPLGTSWDVNRNNETYVAYLFAGGESDAATARSVEFDGDDYLSVAASSDLSLDGDFTVEFWFNSDDQSSTNRRPVITNNLGWGTNFAAIQTNHPSYQGKIVVWDYNMNSSASLVNTNKTYDQGVWHHVAVVRSSNVWTIYVNGIADGTVTQSGTFDLGNSGTLLGHYTSTHYFDGRVSNLRVVKGTAVYTSSFRVPTKPLTNITNTKLLCCNGTSTTSSTVTPGTITANGDPTASSDSPFDDPAAHVFGKSEDQGIIKCGSYVVNGSTTSPPFVHLGFEPAWVLIKPASYSEGWHQFDSIRGMGAKGINDIRLELNTNGGETSTIDYLDISSTGFSPKHSNINSTTSGDTCIYIAIRRPDGYVGKPAAAGTDVFAMDTGDNSAGIPDFDSGFPVDYALLRTPAAAHGWVSSSRLTGTTYLLADDSDDEASQEHGTFDSNVGWFKVGHGSTVQSWMWKRHAGFDVVTYIGNDTAGHQVAHNLGPNNVPEMMWIKKRDDTENWHCYHSGIGNTGGVFLDLNYSTSTSNQFWNDTSPTSSHFTLGSNGGVNGDGDKYIAMLFSSISGISAVGSYTGTGASSSPFGPSISLDFQPRFIIIKNASSSGNWGVWDNLRGLGNESANKLMLNENNAQSSLTWIRDVNSSGFKLYNSDADINTSGDTYLYYAHA